MYKAALIGLGNIAWKLGRDYVSGSSLSHKAAFEKNHKVKLVAGYSPDNMEVQNFSQSCGVNGYVSLEKMLQQENPDIISICSPQEYHADQLEKCIGYNVPMIWLEKPATTSASKSKKLENLRTQSTVTSTILVNFQRRYTESYQKLRQVIKNNLYGKTLLVEVNYSRGLVVNGSHMIDMLAYLFPDSPFDLLWAERNCQHDSPDFLIQIESDLIAHVCGINASYHNIDIIVTCEQARFSILHGGMSTRVEEVQENDMFVGYYRLYDKEKGELGIPGFSHAFDKALENLIDSYENENEPESNMKTAIKSQVLIEKVLKSRVQ
mgnify:FL=1|jgi:predicted dehydrogenase